jgi:hypothetical protein
MALYDVVNVTGAVLVKFQMMTGTFLWRYGDEMSGWRERERRNRI